MVRRADRSRGGVRRDSRRDPRPREHQAAARRDGRDRRVRAQPDARGAGCLGARSVIGRPLLARARSAGEGQRRGALRHAVERAGCAHARLRRRAARVLRGIPNREAARVRERFVLTRAHAAVLQARRAASRARAHPDLARRDRAPHDSRRRRSRGLRDRASHEFVARVSARRDATEARGGRGARGARGAGR